MQAPVSPTAGTKKIRTGDQLNFGLFTNAMIPTNPQDSKQLPGSEDIRSTYPKADRQDANVEVERGEVVLSPDLGTIYDAGGRKHSKGGTPIKAQEGSYIVSDFVATNPIAMDMLGFDYNEKRDKGKTWAKVLKEKVNPVYYNQLTATVADDSKQKPVDPYLLNTANIKVPEFQKIISKVALGNEISKAMVGDKYSIPAIAKIGMESLKKTQPTEDSAPMLEAKSGGLMQFPGGGSPYAPAQYNPNDPGGVQSIIAGITPRVPFDNNTFTPWGGDQYENTQNASHYTHEDIMSRANALGYSGQRDNAVLQTWLYNNPETRPIVDKYHAMYPPTPHGGVLDNKWGYRWDMILGEAARKRNPPTNVPTNNIPQTPGMVNQTLVGKPFTEGTPAPNQERVGPGTVEERAQQPQADASGKRKLGYDWHNVRDVIDANRMDPMRLPWSAKTQPYTVNPQFDDPNYNPMLSANKTRMDVMGQMSNPAIARAVGSYNPDLMSGLVQETQRVRGNDMQAAQQAGYQNASTMNQYAQAEANRVTGDYNNTVKALDNRDTYMNLRRQNINSTVNQADTVKSQMKYLMAQNPQYAPSNPWDYSSDIGFLQGKNLNDPSSRGLTQMENVKQFHAMLTELGYDPEQRSKMLERFIGNLDDNTTTKTTYKGNSSTPAKRDVTERT